MGIATSYANTLLKNMFSGAYLALSITAPSSDGSNVTEPSSDANYSRVAASNGGFTAESKRIKNANYVYYSEATSSWGTIQSLCLYDAKTGGNLRYYGALTTPVSVTADSVPLFRPEAINITLDL